MRYKFTGYFNGRIIKASKKPDGIQNYINIYDFMTLSQVKDFRNSYDGKKVTLELTFKNGLVESTKGTTLMYIYNIKSLRVIGYE